MSNTAKRSHRIIFRPTVGEHATSLDFSNEPEGEFGYYGRAFMEAARVLRRSLARRRGHRMSDVLPLLFLYRHSIELLSKSVILEGNRLMRLSGQGRPENELFAGFKISKHRLLPLLPQINEVLTHQSAPWFFPDSPIEAPDDLQRVFADLEVIDRESFTFRYPTDIQGKQSEGSRTQFGLASMVAVLDSLAEGLDTVVFGLQAEYGAAATAP